MPLTNSVVKRGDIIRRFPQPWKIIPLFVENPEDVIARNALPSFPTVGGDGGSGGCCSSSNSKPLSSSSPSMTQTQHRAEDRSKWMASLSTISSNTSTALRDIQKYEILTALSLVMNGDHEACIRSLNCTSEDDEFLGGDDNNQEEEMMDSVSPRCVVQAWSCIVRDVLSFRQWIILLRYVRHHLWVIPTPHPLAEYATKIVPTLSPSEVQQVRQHLVALFPSSTPQQPSETAEQPESVLALVKKIQDTFQSRYYAVLLQDPSQCIRSDSGEDQTKVEPPILHSCMPTAILEFTQYPPEELVLIALYDPLMDDGDHHHEAEWTVCAIHPDADHDSIEIRDRAIQRRTGSSCRCGRCRWEMNTESSPESRNVDAALDHTFTSPREIKLLAQHYLANGKWNLAQPLYEYLASHGGKSDADVWHALGAIHLGKTNFLTAQRFWYKAFSSEPTLFQKHQGMSLQIAKIHAYRYLQKRIGSPLTRTDAHRSWTSPVPMVFVTERLVTRQTCQQIIEWAESPTNPWTHQRHYAVPTHDIPVHTLPVLLEWFNHFMSTMIRPLLAAQFQTSQNFYAHDAFCVKYQANQVSNHLPIHTDESTHSFVLALNDEYDGGGTYFYESNMTVRLQCGDVVSFRGDQVQHGGEAVTGGTRYIIAVFLYHDDDEIREVPCAGRKRPRNELTEMFHNSEEEKENEFSFGFHVT